MILCYCRAVELLLDHPIDTSEHQEGELVDSIFIFTSLLFK